MRIGINLLFLLPGVVGGTETYAVCLLRELERLDGENQYFLLVNQESAGHCFAAGHRFETIRCPVHARSRVARYAWEQLRLPVRARQLGLDVLHSPGYVAPLRLGCASVVTVHDLNYLHLGAAFGALRRRTLAALVPRSAQRAEIVLTISDASRREIVAELGVPAERVRVTPIAPKPRAPVSAAEFQPIAARHGITGPYVLGFSSSSPHKNIARLLTAFSQIGREFQLQLVLIGHLPERGAPLREIVRELALDRLVVFTGYLPDGDVAQLLVNAEVFAFPSLYEGFGIPVIEAMQAGVPVVSSNAASLPEVVGDAGLLFDPVDVGAITTALHDVLTNTSLRAELIVRGHRRAGEFSWETTARETLRAYGDAVRLHDLALGPDS